MSNGTDVGYEFEEILRKLMDELRQTRPFFYHRFPDTRSASRGKRATFLSPQPSDFLIRVKAESYLLELKASERYTSLTSCLKSSVRNTQAALTKLWIRAGGSSLFLFRSCQDDMVEAWDGKDVVEAYFGGKRLAVKDRLNHVPTGALITFFNILIDLKE